MSEIENGMCTECGMHVKLGEYHPYTACLMYKGCKDSVVVRANLTALIQTWFDMGARECLQRIGQAWDVDLSHLEKPLKGVGTKIKDNGLH